MQSLFQACEEIQVKNLLSTTLIEIWLALGYNGKEVANNKIKLSLLRKFRDKLLRRNATMLTIMEEDNGGKKFANLTVTQKDNVQFDAGEAYLSIIDLLEEEFKGKEWLTC